MPIPAPSMVTASPVRPNILWGKSFPKRSDAPPGAQHERADRRLRRLGAKHRSLGPLPFSPSASARLASKIPTVKDHKYLSIERRDLLIKLDPIFLLVLSKKFL